MCMNIALGAVDSQCPEMVTSLGFEKTPLCAETCKQDSRTPHSHYTCTATNALLIYICVKVFSNPPQPIPLAKGKRVLHAKNAWSSLHTRTR